MTLVFPQMGFLIYQVTRTSSYCSRVWSISGTKTILVKSLFLVPTGWLEKRRVGRAEHLFPPIENSEKKRNRLTKIVKELKKQKQPSRH